MICGFTKLQRVKEKRIYYLIMLLLIKGQYINSYIHTYIGYIHTCINIKHTCTHLAIQSNLKGLSKVQSTCI